jgi:peptidoglycan/xylan/chitin deacetylase (PgdA/CDA1 family)
MQLMFGHEPPIQRRSTTAVRRPACAMCQARSWKVSGRPVSISGWSLASHSYAHDDETKISTERLIHDSTEFRDAVERRTDVKIGQYRDS